MFVTIVARNEAINTINEITSTIRTPEPVEVLQKPMLSIPKKPIIAVKPWGNTKMPTDVQDVADTTVNWNTDSIVDAIETYSLD